MIKRGNEVTHVGQVVAKLEYTAHVSSDNAMIDSGERTMATVAVDGGWQVIRFGGRGDGCLATVDAPAEVIARYEADCCVIGEIAEDNRFVEEREEEREEERRTVSKGKQVIVFKGRKVPVGTKGECFWLGNGTFGERVGIRDSKGNVWWTAKDNCRVA